jgi:hypothetical protein
VADEPTCVGPGTGRDGGLTLRVNGRTSRRSPVRLFPERASVHSFRVLCASVVNPRARRTVTLPGEAPLPRSCGLRQVGWTRSPVVRTNRRERGAAPLPAGASPAQRFRLRRPFQGGVCCPINGLGGCAHPAMVPWEGPCARGPQKFELEGSCAHGAGICARGAFRTRRRSRPAWFEVNPLFVFSSETLVGNVCSPG